MIKDKIFIAFCIAILISNHSSGQEIRDSKSYLILTVTDGFNISIDKPKTYYWIASSDSLNTLNIKFFPLIISQISKKQYSICCRGEAITLNTFTSADSSFDLGTVFYENVENLKKIVNKHGKKIQEIDKKWQSGKREKLIFSITPVVGNFCQCKNLNNNLSSSYPDISLVYIPKTEINYDNDFWDTKKDRYINTIDFSKYSPRYP